MRDVHGDDKEWIVMPKDSIEETCNICNKRFYNLHKHLAYHEENRCRKCAEYFFSRNDYDNHLCAIESDDEDLQNNGNDIIPAYEECRFCFKPITRAQSKKLHENIHRTSGAISCRFCHLKFKTIDAFNIHAFSHRSRKYNKRPIKCRKCGEKFVKYGPFMKHLKYVHKSNKKCQACQKYFTSAKLFSQHQCDKEDSDPTKVFTSDENLPALINSYVPKDLADDEKFYGYSDDEDEPEEELESKQGAASDAAKPDAAPEQSAPANHVDDKLTQVEKDLRFMVSSPIISDVLSLYQQKQEKKQIVDDKDIVNLADDDSMDIDISIPVITID
ncbi:hypothetical protein ACJJTC_004615 [Scirpophaga incertulas]